MRKELMLKFINLWPPFMGAGISVKRMSPDKRTIEVELKTYPWNKNYVGTHFGGSLYAMTDPFFMMILIANLGENYMVWDKAANIKFKKPGRGTVRVKFELSAAQIESVRAEADREDKSEPTFLAQIFDEDNEVVAEVEKLLSIKRKDKIKSRQKK